MTPRTRSVSVVCLLVVAVAAASGVGAGAVTVESLTYGGDSVVSTPDGDTIIWQSDDHTFEVSLQADATHEASVCLFANASTGPRKLGCANASLSAGDGQTVDVSVEPWPANLTGDRTVRAVVSDSASGDRLAERSIVVTVYTRDGDLDGDGLTNEAEVEAGTDLRGRDTDNDSVSDALEVRVHGSDPANNDTDADGLDDGLEVKVYHTDPLDVDTDDDGLSDGHEVDVGTAPTRADTDRDGLDDGPEVNTYQTDPTAVDTDGDGLGDGTEVDLGTNPTVEDTDGDRLTDGEEVTLYDTDPTRSDTDADGLDDHAEVTTHDTDPTRSDTDGDGLDDGQEVTEDGMNPLVADTDADGQDDGLEVRLGSDPTDPTSTGDPGPATTVTLFVTDRPLVAGLGAFLVLCVVGGAVAWRFADRLPIELGSGAVATGGTADQPVDTDGTEQEPATGARPDSGDGSPNAPGPETSVVGDADESATGDGEPVLSNSDPEGGGVYDLPDDAVLTNEERVARLLDENGGRMLQSDMVEAADWSKATVSRVLTRMEEADEITRVDIGRGNLVARPGDEPANAGSPFSEK